MVSVNRAPERFPHISFRDVLGKQEAYVPGTGLAVWEIAWLARVHEDKTEPIARRLSIGVDLIEEALHYAQAYPGEIEPAVRIMEEASEERLRTILPGMRIIDVDLGMNGERTT